MKELNMFGDTINPMGTFRAEVETFEHFLKFKCKTIRRFFCHMGQKETILKLSVKMSSQL